MELIQLKYFLEIANREHVTKAAEALHLAQPALSKSMRLLEEELGVPLFYNKGRGIRLSEYGFFLKEKIEPIVKELTELQYSVQHFIDINQNTVRINVLAASTMITDVIIQYKKIHPNVLFKMTQKGDMVQADIQVDTNGGKTEQPFQTKKRAVLAEEIFIAVPIDSEYAQRDSVDLSELKKCDFIALSGSRKFRPLCDNFCESAGFKPNIVFESDSLISVKNLIASGVGFAFWPEFSWGQIHHDNIKLLPIKNPNCFREIIVYLNDIRKSELCEDFYNFLLKALNQ